MFFSPPFLSSLFLYSMSTGRKVLNREFRFVSYGSEFTPKSTDDSSRLTISCDGRIPGGVALELTHWTDNETPNELYADTSTEMALKLAQQQAGNYCEFNNALILNNHYDTDGVLSVWVCLEPELALQYADLIRQGAEAGDFGEWSSDNGVKLNCVVESFLLDNGGDEEVAYKQALEEVPNVLRDLKNTQGDSYRHLWLDGFQQALSDWEALSPDSFQQGPGKMVLVSEPISSHFVSCYALDRGLREFGLWKGTTRVLRAAKVGSDEFQYQYRYCVPGHGWVKKLVDRHTVPPVDGSKLVKELPRGWTTSDGLTDICHSKNLFKVPPSEVASSLYKLDPGCR